MHIETIDQCWPQLFFHFWRKHFDHLAGPSLVLYSLHTQTNNILLPYHCRPQQEHIHMQKNNAGNNRIQAVYWRRSSHSSSTKQQHYTAALRSSTTQQHYTAALRSSTTQQHYTAALRSSTTQQHYAAALRSSTTQQHYAAALRSSTTQQHYAAALRSSTMQQHYTAALRSSTMQQHYTAALRSSTTQCPYEHTWLTTLAAETGPVALRGLCLAGPGGALHVTFWLSVLVEGILHMQTYNTDRQHTWVHPDHWRSLHSWQPRLRSHLHAAGSGGVSDAVTPLFTLSLEAVVGTPAWVAWAEEAQDCREGTQHACTYAGRQ